MKQAGAFLLWVRCQVRHWQAKTQESKKTSKNTSGTYCCEILYSAYNIFKTCARYACIRRGQEKLSFMKKKQKKNQQKKSQKTQASASAPRRPIGVSELEKELLPKKERRKLEKAAKKRNKRKRLLPVWQIIGILIGFSLLAWPIIADRISAYEADQVISSYTSTTQLDTAEVNARMENARAFNARLSNSVSNYTGEIRDYYEQIVEGGGAFAWIEFPTLAEKLPIFHGTGDDELQVGVGHLEGTSLPIGGTSTHAVLSGHSGMPGSRMFDDIRQLEPGDVFLIHVLDDVLAYEMTDSEVVWPSEVDGLRIQPGKDIVTLVTCTPYGVNDHRLLVHAQRIEYIEDMSIPQTNVALFFNMRTIPFIIALVVMILMLLAMFALRRYKYPLELGVDNPWGGISDATDDRRRNIERVKKRRRNS